MSSLFNSLRLDSHFVASDYKTKGPSEGALTWLLALDQEKQIPGFIEKMKINSLAKRAFNGLTCMHMVVIKNNIKTLELLEDRFPSDITSQVNAQDDNGWTPMHLAALAGNTAMMKKLGVLGGDKNITTKTGLTCNDIIDLTTQSGNYIPKNVTWKGQPWDPSRPYRAMLLWPENTFRDLWRFKVPNNFTYGNAKTIHDFNVSSPKVDIRPVPNAGLGIFAAADIAKNKNLFTYGGVVNHKSNYSSPSPWRYFEGKSNFNQVCYLFDFTETPEGVELAVDARDIRNVCAYANHGWPNCLSAEMLTTGGVSYTGLLRTLAPIQKGEQILWDYGCSRTDLLWGKTVLLEKERMEAYVRANPVEDDFTTDLENLDSDRNIKLTFLLRNPRAWLYLTFRDALNFPLFFKNLCNNDPIWKEHFDCTTDYHQCIQILVALNTTNEFLKSISIFTEEFRKNIKQIVLKSLEDNDILTVLGTLDWWLHIINSLPPEKKAQFLEMQTDIKIKKYYETNFRDIGINYYKSRMLILDSYGDDIPKNFGFCFGNYRDNDVDRLARKFLRVEFTD